MKVLVFAPQYLPIVGGIEILIDTLARQFRTDQTGRPAIEGVDRTCGVRSNTIRVSVRWSISSPDLAGGEPNRDSFWTDGGADARLLIPLCHSGDHLLILGMAE